MRLIAEGRRPEDIQPWWTQRNWSCSRCHAEVAFERKDQKNIAICGIFFKHIWADCPYCFRNTKFTAIPGPSFDDYF